jgi:hypothetical protein
LAYTLNTHAAGNLFVSAATTTPYSISGSNGYTNTAWSTSVAPMTVTQNATIELRGEKADIVINGVSLSDTLAAIESRLAILSPNTIIETEWAELKALGDAYRKLEAEIAEKMKAWNALKDTTL